MTVCSSFNLARFPAFDTPKAPTGGTLNPTLPWHLPGAKELTHLEDTCRCCFLFLHNMDCLWVLWVLWMDYITWMGLADR